MKRSFCRHFFMPLGLSLGLAGCVSYQAKPLMLNPPLAGGMAALNHTLPNGRLVPLTPPLSAQSVAALAVLNDPDLVAARARHNVAQAELLNAGLLPDPVISGGFAALITGAADAPSISGGLAQDVSGLITYPVNVAAAKAGVAQVDAGILWREWQVASQAEQLCITIDGDAQTVASLQADRAALAAVNTSTSRAVAAGNLTIAASSSSLAALAATDSALDTAIQTLNQDRGKLDALLGLRPEQNIAVAVGDVPAIDTAVANAAIASLAIRRPDLIALRYGYHQADAKLRAAIMSQFLPVRIGTTGGRDTTKVISIGPTISLTLPLFNRNRGGIAIASATRDQLAAQFQASLASAEGGARVLQARIGILQSQSEAASRRADDADTIAAQAQTAFVNGTLDAPGAVNLQTASSDRRREAILLRAQLLTARLSLATLLGIGLPPMATPDLEPAP
jgi:outer membrane protein TolC